MISKTPLYAEHVSANAKLVNFFNWEMPLHYGSQIEEHHAVRNSVGMFDVSHMTIVDILGAGGRGFLRRLLANDIDNLTHVGQAMYSCMLNEHGGIIDDLIVYQRSADNFRIILNAATRDKDLAWIGQKSEGFSIGLQERHELAMVAVQGPKAKEKLESILSPAQADGISTLRHFECVDIDNWFFARTGYTGEDGFEIVIPKAEVVGFWQQLLEAGIKPCGLGARDSLRLEAGMMLYGQDMNESTTPYESGLAWTVKMTPEGRDFIGKGALMSQKAQGVTRKMVGLTLIGKGIMRHGMQVVAPGHGDGEITSGGFSPTLNKSIAFARVPIDCGEQVQVDIRGKLVPAKVGKPRFVKNGKAID